MAPMLVEDVAALKGPLEPQASGSTQGPSL
jgi:hypothetical protein